MARSVVSTSIANTVSCRVHGQHQQVHAIASPLHGEYSRTPGREAACREVAEVGDSALARFELDARHLLNVAQDPRKRYVHALDRVRELNKLRALFGLLLDV